MTHVGIEIECGMLKLLSQTKGLNSVESRSVMEMLNLDSNVSIHV